MQKSCEKEIVGVKNTSSKLIREYFISIPSYLIEYLFEKFSELIIPRAGENFAMPCAEIDNNAAKGVVFLVYAIHWCCRRSNVQAIEYSITKCS